MATAERRTRRAATSQPSLVLAAKAGTSGELLAQLLGAYAAEAGAVTVDLLLCEFRPQQRLHDAQADVALLDLAFDSTAGLDMEILTTEGQVAILPTAHPLASRSHVRMADVVSLSDLPMARRPGPGRAHPEGRGAEVRNQTQLFQLIAFGRTTAVLLESCRANLLDGLVAVPVIDAPTVTTVIAWPPHSRFRALADLVRAATRL